MAMTVKMWSINALSVELDMDRRTLGHRLEGLEPDLETKEGKRWLLRRVIRHLHGFDVSQQNGGCEEEILSTLRDDLPELEETIVAVPWPELDLLQKNNYVLFTHIVFDATVGAMALFLRNLTGVTAHGAWHLMSLHLILVMGEIVRILDLPEDHGHPVQDVMSMTTDYRVKDLESKPHCTKKELAELGWKKAYGPISTRKEKKIRNERQPEN